MKIFNRIILVFAVLVSSRILAQQPQPPTAQQLPVKREKELIRFDLDFPGGTPRELVEAIQKASGHPLNAIVPEQYADQRLPPLKMKGVDVSELFNALLKASPRQRQVPSGFGNYVQDNSMAGFMSDGPRTDDSVWYFFFSSTYGTQESCRFYLLTPYLQAGLTVEDITTAIQTSWKMLGEIKPSKLSFHRETKLLIAAGTSSSLQIIDDVLKALSVEQKNSQKPPSSVEAQTAK